MACRYVIYIINFQGYDLLLLGIHDAFELYGRPQKYTWDPRDPSSLMVGYPTGPHKEVCSTVLHIYTSYFSVS